MTGQLVRHQFVLCDNRDVICIIFCNIKLTSGEMNTEQWISNQGIPDIQRHPKINVSFDFPLILLRYWTYNYSYNYLLILLSLTFNVLLSKEDKS